MQQAKSVYLMQYSGPILDQGKIGACYPYATADGMTAFMDEHGIVVGPLSELGLYAHIRDLQNTFSTDSGTYAASGIRAAEQFGISSASTWSNDPSNLYVQPSVAADAEALNFRVLHETDLGAFFTGWQVLEWTIKNQLAHGNDVLLGFQVHAWFFAEKGPLATQINHYTGSNSNALSGGHEVIIVGADDNLNGGSYIIQNSWGTGWGDNGYGTIRYDQFNLSNQNGSSDLLALSVIDSVERNGVVYDNIWTLQTQQVAELYNAILNRAPEHNAFVSATSWIVESRQAQNDFANMLLASDEFKHVAGNQTDSQFVDYIYGTVLGRAPDDGGKAWFLQELGLGVSKGELVVSMIDEIMTSAHWGYYLWAGSSSADPDIKAESLRINNRAEMSQDYGITLQAGDQYGSVAMHILDTITDDPQTVQIALVGLSQILGHSTNS